MSGRRPQALAACLAIVVALVLAACSEPRFEQRSFAEIERALERAGLTICGVEETPRDEVIENAVDQRALIAAFGCGDGDGADEVAVVNVIRWPDQGARDEAIRRYEVASRPSSQNAGLQLAFGQFTIDVTGSRDEDVTARVIGAMKELGAA